MQGTFLLIDTNESFYRLCSLLLSLTIKSKVFLGFLVTLYALISPFDSLFLSTYCPFVISTIPGLTFSSIMLVYYNYVSIQYFLNKFVYFKITTYSNGPVRFEKYHMSMLLNIAQCKGCDSFLYMKWQEKKYIGN